MTIHGTKHDDNLTGTTGDDVFNLQKGGNDTAFGDAGKDAFNMGASLNAADRLDGGDGSDSVFLHGDYSAGLVFDADTIKNIEVLRLGAGFDYNLTLDNGNVAAGETLTVNAGALGSAHSLVFDGSAELDGHFTVYGGAGNDQITGGAQSDLINIGLGGSDTVDAGGGNDTIRVLGKLDSSDTIDGGNGTDTLTFNGDYSGGVTVSGAMVTHVETVNFVDGNDYDITWQSVIADGFTVDASKMSSNQVTFDIGGTHKDVHFIGGIADFFFSGDGNDTFDLQKAEFYVVNGGAGNDTFNLGEALGGGSSVVDGGAGNDVVNLDGDFSHGFVMGEAGGFGGFAGIETVHLAAGHSYELDVFDDIADGSTLTVDGSELHIGNTMTLDMRLATSTAYALTGGRGDDSFLFNDNLTATSTIDGGAGANALELHGNYNIAFADGAIKNIETLKLDAGFDYTITLGAGALTAGQTMTVLMAFSDHALHFDGSAEAVGSFYVQGSQAADYLEGGDGADTLYGTGSISGGDTYAFLHVEGSTSRHFDTISSMTFDVDHILLDEGAYAPTSIGASVTTGQLDNNNHFDAQLAHAMDAAHLAANAVAFFQPDSGDYAGQTFMIVDHNGVAGYQAGQDYVIDLDSASGTFSLAVFSA